MSRRKRGSSAAQPGRTHAEIVAKARSTVRTFKFCTIAIPIILTILLGASSIWEYSTLLALKNHGIHTVGTVVGKHLEGGRRRRYDLVVEFPAGGRMVRRTIDAQMDTYIDVKRGDSVSITYLPNLEEMQIGSVDDDQLRSLVVGRVVMIFLVIAFIELLAQLGLDEFNKATRVLRESKQ